MVGDLSICSYTLWTLSLHVVGNGSLRDVTAPSLAYLVVHACSHGQARTTAPNLMEEWNDAYDPGQHRLTETGRHLHQLAATQWTPMPPLLDRFDIADELSLRLCIPPFPWAYEILENTSKLPPSKALTLGLKLMGHAIGPSILHILRRCSSMTKLEIELIHFDTFPITLCTIGGCHCAQPGRVKTNNVALDSLEEVEIHFFTGSDDEVDLVKLLFMCKKALKKMTINVADDFSFIKQGGSTRENSEFLASEY